MRRYHPYGASGVPPDQGPQWGSDSWTMQGAGWPAAQQAAPWQQPAQPAPWMYAQPQPQQLDPRNVDPSALELFALLSGIPVPPTPPVVPAPLPSPPRQHYNRWSHREARDSGRSSASPRLDSRPRREQPTPPPREREQRVPREWERYSKWKDPVGETRIIPLKCPLSSEFDVSLRKMGLQEEDFLPLEGFIEAQRSLGRRVGLLIDLTDTWRYYDGRRAGERHGLRYEKLRCPGRVAPDRRTVARFADLVDDFLADRPDEWVAVHCTHGVNRTGFLVISYLCERRGMAFPAARELFERSRGERLDDDEAHSYLFDVLRERCGLAPLFPRPPSPASPSRRGREPSRSPSERGDAEEAGEDAAGAGRPADGGLLRPGSPPLRRAASAPNPSRPPAESELEREPPPAPRHGS